MKLHFVELHVRHFSDSVAWYRDVLGMTVTLRDEANRFALLECGGNRLALQAGRPTPGGVLLAFEVDDLTNYLHLSDDLKSSDEGYRRLRLTDPDGYTITLFEWKSDPDEAP